VLLLTPKNSGSISKNHFVRGGRKDVKRVLFMCALVAAKHDKKMKEFYEKLVANGKRRW
jgi:hypothetical protein